MSQLAEILGRFARRLTGANKGPEKPPPPDDRWTTGDRLEVTLFVGDIIDAPAEAVCTSTNPRLSLGGGTGRAMMMETGWGLRRELQRIAEEEARRTGDQELPVGFTVATPGGEPPHRLIVHCVASDSVHRSSPAAARACVEGALAEADRAGCASLALPVFGTGHANLAFDDALQAMGEALRGAAPGSVETVLVVLHVPDRVPLAQKVFDRVLGPARGTG